MRLYPTVPLRSGETPASAMSRLALRHNLSLKSFALDMGVQFQAVVDGKAAAVEHVAALVGCPVELLVNAAIVRTDTTFMLRGQELHKSNLRRARITVCPRCVAEDLADGSGTWMPSGRVAWLLDPIRTCRQHRVAIIEVTNVDTSAPLHDFARRLGPSLEDFPRLANDAKTVEPSLLEHYLLDRLDGHPGPAWLDALPWHAAARTSEMIGAVQVFGRNVPIAALNDDQWRQAGAAGYEIVAGGENSVRDFLDHMRTCYPEAATDPTGPQAWFGRFHRWLTTMKLNAYDPVRAVVADYVRETVPVGPDDKLYGRQIVETRRLHSIRTASLECKLNPKRLRRYLAFAGIIPPDHGELTDDRVIFSASAAEPTLLRAKRAITQIEAETYLNAGRVHTKLLTKANIIKPFSSSGQEALRRHSYDRRDLDDFLSALSARAQVMPVQSDPIYRIPEAARRARCSAVEIVNSILDGELKWVGRIANESGFMSILVDVTEVRQLVRGDYGDMLPLTIVGALLKTTSHVVSALIRLRILPSGSATNPINRCPYTAVKADDLKAFQAEFGSLHVLARERGLSIGSMKEALTKLGIKPAFSKPAVPATFYRRSDVPKRL